MPYEGLSLCVPFTLVIFHLTMQLTIVTCYSCWQITLYVQWKCNFYVDYLASAEFAANHFVISSFILKNMVIYPGHNIVYLYVSFCHFLIFKLKEYSGHTIVEVSMVLWSQYNDIISTLNCSEIKWKFKNHLIKSI